ncbi:MAG: hypothetical protein N4A48_01340 [Tepidibacter sp.]|uniref:hypothetical protein n=1 Tax=Tepidibacter sp. TaxID=2529387 RepID=UPI0025D7326F|nr:hypothetical protein [Tepidibacter sp.]MCT4507402.1 hypothetical protein [Tepidibacter sp.]
MKNKYFKWIFFIICTLILVIVIKYSLIIKRYNKVDYDGYDTLSIVQHPFYSNNDSVEFLIDDSAELDLKLWWKSLSGDIEVKITDDKGNIYFTKKSSQIKNEYDIPLKKGKYKLNINSSNFTGAMVLGYKNIVKVNKFPNDNYSIISSNPSYGFGWEYILYIPNKVSENNLLVVPNNTGRVSENIDIHKEKAKELILAKSRLAEELGVPLIVPIFPRSENYQEIYTHALDRATMLTDIDELKRLDLQLIAMINHTKNILLKKGITLDNQIFMSGFSASGNFVDRFTFLHPEIVKAATIGGCDNIIPYKNLNGQNLPYPIGVYDYEKITGKEFDVNLIDEVYRYIYKGEDDEGGWITSQENGKVTTYTGKEYFDKFEAPKITKNIRQNKFNIYNDGDLTDLQKEEISFRVYNGKILVDRFLLIKSIFDELNLDRSQFVVYKEIGHEINQEIEDDELEFFKNVLNY